MPGAEAIDSSTAGTFNPRLGLEVIGAVAVASFGAVAACHEEATMVENGNCSEDDVPMQCVITIAVNKTIPRRMAPASLYPLLVRIILVEFSAEPSALMSTNNRSSQHQNYNLRLRKGAYIILCSVSLCRREVACK